MTGAGAGTPHRQAPLPRQDWTVLLIGGPSGRGKTSAAHRIGTRLGVPWLQVDDLRLALQWSKVSLPANTEALYFFLDHPAVWTLPPERLRDGLIAVGGVMAPAIDVVVSHHMARGQRLIIEGDGILPALVQRPTLQPFHADGRLRAAFIVEGDKDAWPAGTPDNAGEQDGYTVRERRAQDGMNQLFGQWLAAEARLYGLPIVEPRPWDTLAERLLACVWEGAGGAATPP